MNVPRRISIFACLITLLMSGCQKDEILTVNQMVDILFDIYRFDATVQNISRHVDNETHVKYYNGIFVKHHTDKAHFDKSLEWYANHPEQWRLVHEKLELKGKDFEMQIQNGQLPELKARGIEMSNIDTMDFWISKENMYWYKDNNAQIDSDRISQVLDGRKYFVGARKIELTLRMRCEADSDVTVNTMLIVQYIKDKSKDTFQVKTLADNRWRKYYLSTGMLNKGISNVTVILADDNALSKMSSIEYENVHLSYIFPKDAEHIDEAEQRIFNRQKTNKRNRQNKSNTKRVENGEKNSSEQDKYSTLPLL